MDSPNNGWPRSGDPTADSIEPPVAGGKPAEASGDKPKPPPADDESDGEKVARLDQRRAR